jgi:hypothetical protein
MNADRGGVARVFRQGNATAVQVVMATRSELGDLLPGCSDPVATPPAARTVQGSVTGLEAPNELRVHLGNVSLRLQPGSPVLPFNFPGVRGGPFDVVAVHSRPLEGSAFERYPTSVVINRGAVSSSAVVMPAIDIGSGAVRTLDRAVRIGDVGGDVRVNIRSRVLTATTVAMLSDVSWVPPVGKSEFASGSEVTGEIGVLPSAALSAGESQEVTVTATGSGFTGSTRQRSIVARYPDVPQQDLTLGPPVDVELFVLKSGEVARVEASYVVPPAYDGTWTFISSQANRTVSVVMSRGYAGTDGHVSLLVPDLRALEGFQASWLLAVREITSWSFRASSQDIASVILRLHTAQYREGVWGIASSFAP